MVVGGNTDGNLRAPTADGRASLLAARRALAALAALRRHRAIVPVYLYIDEIGALRALPRNALRRSRRRASRA